MGHYTGLMHFGREAAGTVNIPVFAMPRMKKFLSTNGPWNQLIKLNNITINALSDNHPVKLNQRLKVTPLLVPHRDEYSETVGFLIDGSNRKVLFIPDIDKWSKWNRDIVNEIKRVDYAFLDATFFAGGELPGRDMSEVPHPFVKESIKLFSQLSKMDRQKIHFIHFIHFNHSNPLLQDNSRAQQIVFSEGYRIAKAGLRLSL